MGLFRRREPKFPDLVALPPMAELPKARLQSAARYLGTVNEQDEKITGQSMAAKSSSRLNLSDEALDVVRMAGSFRIPAGALRGATTATHFAGKPVRDLLVVRWEHGEQQWRTGFRMDASKNAKAAASVPELDQWVRTISKMSRGK
jgi:hypothetical protein